MSKATMPTREEIATLLREPRSYKDTLMLYRIADALELSVVVPRDDPRFIDTGSPKWDAAAFQASKEGHKPGSGEWMQRIRELLAVAAYLDAYADRLEADAALQSRAQVHGLKVTGDLAEYLWRVLDYYANETNYRGQRTGGVVAGCPRGPDPTVEEMTYEATVAKRRMKAAYEAQQQAEPTIPVSNPNNMLTALEQALQDSAGKVFSAYALTAIYAHRDRILAEYESGR